MQPGHVDQAASGSEERRDPPSDQFRMEHLESEVSRIDLTMTCIMHLLEKSPLINPNVAAEGQANAPAAPVENHAQAAGPQAQLLDIPPHLRHTADSAYRPPTGPECSHLARLEPLKLPDVWFSGDSGSLTSFLRTIRDFLRPRGSLLQSEA